MKVEWWFGVFATGKPGTSVKATVWYGRSAGTRPVFVNVGLLIEWFSYRRRIRQSHTSQIRGKKPFLSYATENGGIAEEIYFALVGAGHEVFVDRPSLKPGDNYDRRLREAIESADGVIFLISPQSVQIGGYALTELKYARQKWVHPERRVLPVMVTHML